MMRHDLTIDLFLERLIQLYRDTSNYFYSLYEDRGRTNKQHFDICLYYCNQSKDLGSYIDDGAFVSDTDRRTVFYDLEKALELVELIECDTVLIRELRSVISKVAAMRGQQD